MYTSSVCVCVPHPQHPSHPIPLGHPSAPGLSTLSHALNLDWRFVSHVIIYMFQCHSLISSHPRPLPQSPKDCSIHLCMLSCIQGYRYHLSKFHKYALVYCIIVFLPGLLYSVKQAAVSSTSLCVLYQSSSFFKKLNCKSSSILKKNKTKKQHQPFPPSTRIFSGWYVFINFLPKI